MPDAEDVESASDAHVLCSEQAVNSGRQSAPRFLSTLDRYSCQTTLSFSSSLTIDALQAGGEVVSGHLAGAEVAGQGHAVGEHRNRLGRGEHAGRDS